MADTKTVEQVIETHKASGKFFKTDGLQTFALDYGNGEAVQNVPYPIQVIWGAKDPGLTIDHFGKEIQKATDVKEIAQLPARHFLQEEQWENIADKIEEIIHRSHEASNF